LFYPSPALGPGASNERIQALRHIWKVAKRILGKYGKAYSEFQYATEFS
jgi:hypothetical protein